VGGRAERTATLGTRVTQSFCSGHARFAAQPGPVERLVAAVISRPPSPDPAGPAGPSASGRPPDGLTTREPEVLSLLASGLSNAEIAQRLYLSHATVKTHINRIFAKTGVRDRAQAVRYAYQHGLSAPAD
jgi:DNA-binding NarL/FixJ family response regulator